jgi:NAD(P)-dependent dehydrogenase (short-subunit alcohol dehydrogenase family)
MNILQNTSPPSSMNSIPSPILDPLFDVRDQVILVTGGGGVLPGALARGLAARGARVALLGRTRSKTEAVAAEIRALGGAALALDGDVTVRASVEAAVVEVLDNFGRIDHLINGAGGQRPGAIVSSAEMFFELPIQELDAVLELNLWGSVLPSQVVGKFLAQQGRGSILNLSSMAAQRPLSRAPWATRLRKRLSRILRSGSPSPSRAKFHPRCASTRSRPVSFLENKTARCW